MLVIRDGSALSYSRMLDTRTLLARVLGALFGVWSSSGFALDFVPSVKNTFCLLESKELATLGVVIGLLLARTMLDGFVFCSSILRVLVAGVRISSTAL
jgi:hypothetical protein